MCREALQSRKNRIIPALVAALILTAGPHLVAQRGRYLTLSDAEVRRELHVSELNPNESFDSTVLSLSHPIFQFLAVSPQIRWSSNPADRGTKALPVLGIVIDRNELLDLHNRLESGQLEDLLRFILAHEAAHMAQYQRYPREFVADSFNTRRLECQADLWAGMAVMNVLTGMHLVPREILRRILPAIALAHIIGHGSFDDHRDHPRPDQRALCTTFGLRAGAYLWEVQRLKKTHEPSITRLVDGELAADPNLFRVGSDLWAWSDHIALQMTQAGGRDFVGPGGPVNLPRDIRILADAAEHGPSALSNDSLLHFSSLSNCRRDVLADTTRISCPEDPAVSHEMAQSDYTNDVSLLRTALLSRGWTKHTEAGGRAESFERGSARFTIRYDVKSKVISYVFSAWRPASRGP